MPEQADRRARCPKSMMHGPCGGVGDDGGCEVAGLSCSFADLDRPVGWSGGDQQGSHVALERLDRVVSDVRLDVDPTRSAPAFERLRAGGVSVLVGEHLDETVVRRPAESCRIARSLGVDAVVTITGRGRTQDEARAEIAATARHDPVAIHCVTGDHPAARALGPPDARPFATESMQLIEAVVRSTSTPASVAESPASRPRRLRPGRLAEKQRAGATLAILNHAGSVDDLIAFADAARLSGATLPLIAPVPLVTDRTSADVLAAFPGLVPPPGHFDAIATADDPREEGVARAADMASRLLDSGRFVAVNLSGSGSAGGMSDRVALICEVVARLDDLSPGTGTR